MTEYNMNDKLDYKIKKSTPADRRKALATIEAMAAEMGTRSIILYFDFDRDIVMIDPFTKLPQGVLLSGKIHHE